MVWNRQNTTTTLVAATALTLTLSCSKQLPTNATSTPKSSIVSTTPPYQTREPEQYQATRTITFTPSSAGETATTTSVSIARDGESRREEEAVGSTRVVYLYLPTGRFVLLPDRKLYADLSGVAGNLSSAGPTVENPEEAYLHTGPIQSTYEDVGIEYIAGRSTKKYRIVVNGDSGGTVSSSEVTVWVDPELGMPIKSVTTSPAGVRTMELQNLTQNVDKRLFEVPPGYQKVDFQAVRQQLSPVP